MTDTPIYWRNDRGHERPNLESEADQLTEDEVMELSEEEFMHWSLATTYADYIPCSLCRRLPARSKLEGLDGIHDFHDACIADLPRVDFACCGHGTCTPYLVFSDGLCLYGRAAVSAMEVLGGNPPETACGVADLEGVVNGVAWKSRDALEDWPDST